MSQAYLQVTYRKGKPLAAYYYLPRQAGDTAARTQTRGNLVIDYASDGRLIGIELTAPRNVNLAELNRLLEEANQKPLASDELLPLAMTA